MNIPLPLPPTDNLYKFTAISGLLLVALSTVLPWWSVYHFEIQLIENEGEVEQLELEAAQLEAKARKLEGQVSEAEKRLSIESGSRGSASAARDDRGLTTMAYTEMQNAASALARELQSMRTKHVQVHTRTKMNTFLASLVRIGTRSAFVGVTAGMLLSGAGFILWYVRVQRPLDRLLALQAKSPPVRAE